MAAPKRTEFERERDLHLTTQLYLKGKTQAEIAEELNVSREQIKYDLARTGELNSFELADLFGTTEPTVSEILTGKLYKHVKREPLPKRGIEKARMEAKRKKLLSLYADGLSYADIGEKVGLDSNTVWRNLKSILGDSPVSADMRQVEQRNEKIVSERLLGKTVREISSTVGISVDVVRRELKKAGIYKPDDPKSKSRPN